MNPKASLAKLFYVDLASVSDHFIPTSNVDSFHFASDLSWVEKKSTRLMQYTHFFLSYEWANQILAKSIFRRHDTTKIKLKKQDKPAAYHKSNQHGLLAKSTLYKW